MDVQPNHRGIYRQPSQCATSDSAEIMRDHSRVQMQGAWLPWRRRATAGGLVPPAARKAV
jgi:hypothetical protein